MKTKIFFYLVLFSVILSFCFISSTRAAESDNCPTGSFLDEYGRCVSNSTSGVVNSDKSTGAGNSCPSGSFLDEYGRCVSNSTSEVVNPNNNAGSKSNCPAGSFEDEYGRRISKSNGAIVPSNNSIAGGIGGGGAKCGAGYVDQGGVCFPSNTGLSEKTVMEIVNSALNWLLGIFGILAIIAFIISGVQYMLSAGNEKAVDTAKRNMNWSLVGVAVALSGLVIIYAIDKALRATTMF